MNQTFYYSRQYKLLFALNILISINLLFSKYSRHLELGLRTYDMIIIGIAIISAILSVYMLIFSFIHEIKLDDKNITYNRPTNTKQVKLPLEEIKDINIDKKGAIKISFSEASNQKPIKIGAVYKDLQNIQNTFISIAKDRNILFSNG